MDTPAAAPARPDAKPIASVPDASRRMRTLAQGGVKAAPFAFRHLCPRRAGPVRHRQQDRPCGPNDGRPPLPADPAADLLRLVFLMDRGDIAQDAPDPPDPPLRETIANESAPIGSLKAMLRFGGLPAPDTGGRCGRLVKAPAAPGKAGTVIGWRRLRQPADIIPAARFHPEAVRGPEPGWCRAPARSRPRRAGGPGWGSPSGASSRQERPVASG